MTYTTSEQVTGIPSRAQDRVLIRLWKNRNGRIGLLIVSLLLLAALASLLGLLPYSPTEQHPADSLRPPSAEYWMGTDQFGRDIFSRVADGIKASLQVAVMAVFLASIVGTLMGIVAGFFGGPVDRVLTRVMDVLFSFPAILLALAVVAALGGGLLNTALAIAVVYTPIFARVARGPVLAIRDVDYVRAGRVLGFSPARLLLRHILPNITAAIVVQIALALSWAILTESGLSFLGLGTQPPQPSLGLMVSDARTLAITAWWTLAFPSVAIVVAVIGLNLLGDGLRDVLDPTHQD
jgi:peptide/nickel transport system permease protein